MKPSPYQIRHAAVKEFMTAFGQHMHAAWDNVDNKDALNRHTLHDEEFKEYNAASEVVDVLDAVIDIEYITHGTMHTLAIKMHDGIEDMTTPLVSFPQANAYALRELTKQQLCHKGLRSSLNQLLMLCSQAGHVITRNYHDAFMHVHERNMAKLWTKDELFHAPDGYTAKDTIDKDGKPAARFVVYRPDGKIVKPPGFKPPDLSKWV